MAPKALLTIYFIATICGVGLIVYEFFGQSSSPDWIGYMWGIYTIAMAWMTYYTWKNIESSQ